MSTTTKSCCGPTCCQDEKPAAESITTAVREKYGAVATSTLSSKHEGVRAVAEAFERSRAVINPG